MAGTAADAVRLLGNAHEDGFNVHELQAGVELLGFGNGRAEVGFAGHEQRRRFDFIQEIGERALHVLVGVVPGIAGEPIFSGPRNVAGKDEAVPVDDGIEASRGAETVGVLDGPGSEHASAAATGDKEIVGVNVALGDDRVHAAVHVIEIVAGIGVVNEIGELFAVAGAAARIGIENDVAHGSPHLFFKIEAIAVITKRTAVNLENERIFFVGVEIRRLNDPAFDLAAIF